MQLWYWNDPRFDLTVQFPDDAHVARANRMFEQTLVQFSRDSFRPPPTGWLKSTKRLVPSKRAHSFRVRRDRCGAVSAESARTNNSAVYRATALEIRPTTDTRGGATSAGIWSLSFGRVVSHHRHGTDTNYGHSVMFRVGPGCGGIDHCERADFYAATAASTADCTPQQIPSIETQSRQSVAAPRFYRHDVNPQMSRFRHRDSALCRENHFQVRRHCDGVSIRRSVGYMRSVSMSADKAGGCCRRLG